MNGDTRKDSKPRVAPYFPSLGEVGLQNVDVHMFTADIHDSVGLHRQERYSLNVSPSFERETLSVLGSVAREDYGDRPEVVGAAVKRIAGLLAAEGRAVHQIWRSEESGGTYALYGFTSQRLYRVFGQYIQVIPKADRAVWKKAYVVVPKTEIWDIAMPDMFGGSRGYRTILRRLARFPRPGPLFFEAEPEKRRWPVRYEWKRYAREKDLYTAKSTGRWGWNLRDSSGRNWTEFYYFYRTIQFQWAQAVVREHIVNEFNRLFMRLGIEAQIEINGIPTASEILSVRQRLSAGSISFIDAYDRCSG